jgi:hypothetical protein
MANTTSVPDLEEIIPFSSYFQEEKISVTLPSDLTFHDIAYGSPPLRTANSKWVNYVFEDEYGKYPKSCGNTVVYDSH